MRRGALPLSGEARHRIGAVVPGDDLGQSSGDAGMAEVGLDLHRPLLGQRSQLNVLRPLDPSQRGQQGEEQLDQCARRRSARYRRGRARR
jgi:hypothetical protein